MKKGDTFKDHRTGKVYTVRMVAEERGILVKEANSPRQIMITQSRKAGLRVLGKGLFTWPFGIQQPPPEETPC